jgi:hypothetical protein
MLSGKTIFPETREAVTRQSDCRQKIQDRELFSVTVFQTEIRTIAGRRLPFLPAVWNPATSGRTS